MDTHTGPVCQTFCRSGASCHDTVPVGMGKCLLGGEPSATLYVKKGTRRFTEFLYLVRIDDNQYMFVQILDCN